MANNMFNYKIAKPLHNIYSFLFISTMYISVKGEKQIQQILTSHFSYLIFK